MNWIKRNIIAQSLTNLSGESPLRAKNYIEIWNVGDLCLSLHTNRIKMVDISN